MAVKLYWTALSHPSEAVRTMLDLKGVDYELVPVLVGGQRLHVRLAGFRGGTIPALRLDGRRLQGSRTIARALDQRWPDPPLYPTDPPLRARVEEAELWGEQSLQPIPRRIARYSFASSLAGRRWLAEEAGLPAPALVALLTAPLARYYTRVLESDGRRAAADTVREDLARLPAVLDHVDALLADGTLTVQEPNAATLQVLSSISLLEAMSDLQPHVAARPCGVAAREVFPRYPADVPSYLPAAWLEPLRAPARA